MSFVMTERSYSRTAQENIINNAPIGASKSVTISENAIKLPIHQYTTDHGLPANTVHSVVRDRLGFLWIATVNGLARYDGYRFLHYTLPKDPLSGVPERNIRQVMAGPHGEIKAITRTGTFRYNPARDRFEGAGYTIPVNSSFAKNRDIVLLNSRWIHLEADSLAVLRDIEHQESQFVAEPIRTIALAHDAAWLAGYRNAIKIDAEFNITETELPFPHSDAEWGIRIFPASNPDWLWIARLVDKVEAEVYRYNYTTGELIRVFDGQIPEVQQIIEDDYGRTWILTHFNGLFLFDVDRAQMIPVQGLHGVAAKTMVLYDDILWVSGAGNGLFKIDIKPYRFNTVAATDQFGTMQIGNLTKNIYARGDEVWFIHSISQPTYLNYINLIDGTGESRVIFHEGQPVTFIDMHTLDGEEFWFGTSGGMMPIRYSWSTGETLKPAEPRFPVRISGILAGNEETIWMHTYDQIIKWSNSSGDYSVIPIFSNVSPGTAEGGYGGWFSQGTVDVDRGVLWFIMRNYLGRLDIETETISLLPIPQVGTRNLKHVELIDGKLWIASESGLLFLNPDTDETIFFTESDGLPDSFVYGLLQDQFGDLWISTNRGLSRATVKWTQDLPELTFKNYNVGDGLQSNEFNTYSFFRDSSDDRLWFGGTGGLSWFYPAQIDDHSVTPRLIIDDFRLFNTTVVSDTAFAYKKHWHIPYSENDFSLLLSGLIYRRTEEIQYAWKLEGQDPDWMFSDQRSYIRYTNLRPGKYRLLAKAANYDGVWGPEYQWFITVSRPWWLSYWFIGFMVLFTGGSAMGISRYLTWLSYRKRLLELEKRELVNKERTRISRDLHDEIGANLTHIAILSELAQQELHQAPKTSQTVERVARVARDNISTLSEIVWSLNPGNDSLEQVATYIQNYTESFFDNTEIRTKFEIQEQLPNVILDSDVRHHLLMCVKEALNNACKYSRASEVMVKIDVNDHSVTIIIQDNGIGFNRDEVRKKGNGLTNLEHRLKPFGGSATIDTKPGSGCRIEFRLPLHYQ
jgi:signal transduction histidine kinase/ligand-binding sensor domain-containing protein